MYTPNKIANFFLQKSFDSGIEVTPMKLLKLVYIAHGWYLAIFDEPLLPEAVEAWKYGPVVKSVYDNFKSYGTDPIKDLKLEDDDGNLKSSIIEDDLDRNFLEKVWDEYSDLSAYQLSNLTHQKNTPWDIVWNKRGGKKRFGEIIPNKIIEEHYREKINANEQRRAAKTN